MSKKKTTEQFIEEAKKVHGDKYDYSKVEYVDNHTKVKIICPIHGEFLQKPLPHLQGQGCSACGRIKSAEKRKKPIEQFIEEAKKVHGDKYDYSKTEYVGDKVRIVCPIHGEFLQSADNHLKGCGCPKDGYLKVREKLSIKAEQFIEKAKKVHGDKYDYSKVEYINGKTKVIIICPKHGEFLQTPNGHLDGCGCKKCWEERRRFVYRKTTEQFIEDAKKIHGDKYDYSLVEYKNSNTPVKIIHKECGRVFEQKPSNHLDGCGCIHCYATPKKTTKQFIEDARKVHGDKYDYSLVDYKNGKMKVKIICPKHGVFEQSPNSHLRGDKCPNCAPNKKITFEEFVDKAREVHGDKYDYSREDFKNTYTKTKIICKKHGEFWQVPLNHLGGHGCQECRKEFLREKFAMPLEEFIERSNKIHKNKYDYSKVEYVNISIPVKIICPIHGEFNRKPASHLDGSGCSICDGWKGEMRIANYLDDIGLKYLPHKTFDDLKDVRLLSYDFYIESKNLLIEFNGGQHYEFISYFHKALHDFHRQKRHDWMKRKYAIKNEYKLISIPYWEYENIEEILQEELK